MCCLALCVLCGVPRAWVGHCGKGREEDGRGGGGWQEGSSAADDVCAVWGTLCIEWVFQQRQSGGSVAVVEAVLPAHVFCVRFHTCCVARMLAFMLGGCILTN